MKLNTEVLEESRKLLQDIQKELDLLELSNNTSRVLKLRDKIDTCINKIVTVEQTVGWGLLKFKLSNLKKDKQ